MNKNIVGLLAPIVAIGVMSFDMTAYAAKQEAPKAKAPVAVKKSEPAAEKTEGLMSTVGAAKGLISTFGQVKGGEEDEDEGDDEEGEE